MSYFNSSTDTTNFMGGKSYKLDPLQSLKVVCTSMICGESQYYRRDNGSVQFLEHFLFPGFYEESATNYFDKIVSDALDHDFEGCLDFVSKLRNEYFMRLNSNYLLARALTHPKRVEFNKTNPKVFKTIIGQVGCIPTDWTTQYKLLKESRKPIPTIWKRAIADKLHNMSAYHAAKYLHGSKTKGKIINAQNDSVDEPVKDLANLVDLIRITHPKPTNVINQLVKTGKVEIADDEQTWEKLRSAKKTWTEINLQIRLPHTALLRNLLNIINEYATRQDTEEAMHEIVLLTTQLINGVKGGKQFPFRYFIAYKMLTSASNEEPIFSNMRDTVLKGLNCCVLESVECIPPMNGRVECLSDNSGSSRQGMISEYGNVEIFEISNLSAILTAYRAKKGGSVWVFGDRLEEYVVSKKPILEQLEEVNKLGDTVGGATETGIWLFWEKFIKDKTQTDNVFIYTDMQAATGELFVDTVNTPKLNQMGAALYGTNVDVLKLVQIYREKVFSKVNVFSVQVAGYDNTVLPDILYRGAILSGWTGKEAKLAHEMSTLWDEIELPKPTEGEWMKW